MQTGVLRDVLGPRKRDSGIIPGLHQTNTASRSPMRCSGWGVLVTEPRMRYAIERV